MSLRKNDDVYHCAFCEASHTFQREGLKCPTCGRKYCVDSINTALDAGRDSCPYCETTQFQDFQDTQESVNIHTSGKKQVFYEKKESLIHPINGGVEIRRERKNSESSDAIEAILTILEFNPSMTIDKLCLVLDRIEEEINPILKLLVSQGKISFEGKNILLLPEYIKNKPEKKTPERHMEEDFVVYFLWVTIPVLFTFMFPFLIFGYLIAKTWSYRTDFGNKYQRYISISSNDQGKKFVIVPLILFSILGSITLIGSIFICFGIFGVNFYSLLLFFVCWFIFLMLPIVYRNIV